MTYVTKSWGNDPTGGTPLNATGLDDWESRIAAAVNVGALDSGWLYATDFGVTADGVTDDSTALNNALLAATGPSETIRTSLVLPAGYIMVGSQIIVGNGVRVLGAGKRGSHIKALPSFPTNTPVVRLGDPAQPIAFDMRLENVSVGANGIANSTCVYSRNANEGSGCFSVLVEGFGKYGIWYESCSIVDCVDIEAFGDGGLATAIAGIYYQGCAGENMVRSATVTPASAAGYGVWFSGTQGHISDIHCEQAASGIRITSGSGNIENISGNPSVVDLVHIEANTRDWTAQNIRQNGSTNTLVDDLAGLTINEQNLQFYFQDNLRINKTRMISSGGDPNLDTNPHIRGEIAWNNTPTAGGGASPFAGWICVTAGTPGTWKTFGAISA